MNFYSQFEQDRFVYENYFQGKTDGYFVDIGAFDGVSSSNSLFFEELGWRGVCVEPNPEMFAKLDLARKCDKHQCAIGDMVGRFDFFQIKDGGPSTLSGLVSEYDQQAVARIHKELGPDAEGFDYIQVQCKTFADVVKENNIDFLSLDTEGNELKILKSIDFKRYNISVITVENNNYDNTFINFLVPKGYTFIGRLGCDEVYKKS